MMLPILISVSVAPVSYFFCASAALVEATKTASAMDTGANLPVTAGIPISLFFLMCVRHSFSGFLGDAAAIEYDLRCSIKKKPLRRRRRDCFFSSHLFW